MSSGWKEKKREEEGKAEKRKGGAALQEFSLFRNEEGGAATIGKRGTQPSLE